MIRDQRGSVLRTLRIGSNWRLADRSTILRLRLVHATSFEKPKNPIAPSPSLSCAAVATRRCVPLRGLPKAGLRSELCSSELNPMRCQDGPDGTGALGGPASQDAAESPDRDDWARRFG